MNMQDFMVYINSKSLGDVLREYPIGNDFLANFRLDAISKDMPL
ncbi:MAG TPA: ABC transporter, partial [Pelotomaculum sp.]|nr:ABC transporter [Pelotomaculum sp.]